MDHDATVYMNTPCKTFDWYKIKTYCIPIIVVNLIISSLFLVSYIHNEHIKISLYKSIFLTCSSFTSIVLMLGWFCWRMEIIDEQDKHHKNGNACRCDDKQKSIPDLKQEKLWDDKWTNK